ncbi:putative MFS transporter [Macrophomina phaseolina]|uniref:MFS transporter n=1 Tax=Macrophomina phaseolina TaxID=35725 RepID=A0ABQ8GEI3_9PEZI|nr:putative MFS transporter [Macrophomina phaseolina]
MGILNDREIEEVPGSVLLLSKVSQRNEPLGLRNAPARTSFLIAPFAIPCLSAQRLITPREKADPGRQDHSGPSARGLRAQTCCLVVTGLFSVCLVAAWAPVLAAGFNNVAQTYKVSVPGVALTTGLYMLGLGLGSVVASPTAILYGERPVYLVGAILCTAASVWCALSPNYASLLVARIVQGFAVPPVECLPSATIAEIFFLHERAYRLGIYTLLLLGGKNLIPLVSAAVIPSLGWRWGVLVFWMVAIVVAFSGVLLFLIRSIADRRRNASFRVGFAEDNSKGIAEKMEDINETSVGDEAPGIPAVEAAEAPARQREACNTDQSHIDAQIQKDNVSASNQHNVMAKILEKPSPGCFGMDLEAGSGAPTPGPTTYTDRYRKAPKKTYAQPLAPYVGRLSHDSWFRVMVRPFILFAYPAVLWSTVWLITLSESVSEIYRSKHTYNFTALQAGLVYVSPFVGGIIGTAVAGKVSDVIVRWMARRNDGVYEPEFRLVMAFPVATCTAMGLMGFGWSAKQLATIFFGVISFGCSLGSTTAITFCVDSYRQYAGEALVTLSFAKNVFHGFVFSLSLTHWLEDDGPKKVFLAIGAVQLGCLLLSIPM